MTKVKICGVPYALTRVSGVESVDHSGSDAELWGQISYVQQSIRFAASSPERELRTVLHEILHGVVENGGIRELQDKEGNHFEMPIDQLANGLAEALESLGMKLPLMGTRRKGM